MISVVMSVKTKSVGWGLTILWFVDESFGKNFRCTSYSDLLS